MGENSNILQRELSLCAYIQVLIRCFQVMSEQIEPTDESIDTARMRKSRRKRAKYAQDSARGMPGYEGAFED